MSYVNVNVDIDIDDVKNEVLEEISDDDLIKELERRGLKDNVNDDEYYTLKKFYFTPDDLYRHLCDICDCGYHEPKESLLNKLKGLM